MEMFWDEGLRRRDFGKIVLESRLLFRYGIKMLFETVYHHKMPFFVVSGGMTDIIKASFYTLIEGGELDT